MLPVLQDGTKPVVYTVEEVAEVLRVPYRRVLQLIRLKVLRAIKIGNHYRIPAIELQRFIEEGGMMNDQG